MKIVNLAQNPFENRRPVRRLAATLWLVGGLFTLLNLWLFWENLTGFAATTGKLAGVREQTGKETAEIARLGEEVAGLALEEQNDEVEVLNRLIADRVFPWGLLFDRLETVLPDQVWLVTLQPRRAKAESRAAKRRRGRAARRSRQAQHQDPGVELVLRGQARDSKALYAFVDRLFEDPVFRGPNLRDQARNSSGALDFNLGVVFLAETAQAMATGKDAAQQQASAETARGEPRQDAASIAGPPAANAGEQAAGEQVAGEQAAGDARSVRAEPDAGIATSARSAAPAARSLATPSDRQRLGAALEGAAQQIGRTLERGEQHPYAAQTPPAARPVATTPAAPAARSLGLGGSTTTAAPGAVPRALPVDPIARRRGVAIIPAAVQPSVAVKPGSQPAVASPGTGGASAPPARPATSGRTAAPPTPGTPATGTPATGMPATGMPATGGARSRAPEPGVDPEDLRPVPARPPASSAARIRGGRG